MHKPENVISIGARMEEELNQTETLVGPFQGKGSIKARH